MPCPSSPAPTGPLPSLDPPATGPVSGSQRARGPLARPHCSSPLGPALARTPGRACALSAAGPRRADEAAGPLASAADSTPGPCSFLPAPPGTWDLTQTLRLYLEAELCRLRGLTRDLRPSSLSLRAGRAGPGSPEEPSPLFPADACPRPSSLSCDLLLASLRSWPWRRVGPSCPRLPSAASLSCRLQEGPLPLPAGHAASSLQSPLWPRQGGEGVASVALRASALQGSQCNLSFPTPGSYLHHSPVVRRQPTQTSEPWGHPACGPLSSSLRFLTGDIRMWVELAEGRCGDKSSPS